MKPMLAIMWLSKQLKWQKMSNISHYGQHKLICVIIVCFERDKLQITHQEEKPAKSFRQITNQF